MLKNIPSPFDTLEELFNKNCVFVDKTQYIEQYEKANKSITTFTRPRGFGKSIFLQCLYYYYDIALKEKMDKILFNTYIYNHPTSYKSKYAVIKFDFSIIDTKSSAGSIKIDFRLCAIKGISDFYKRYPDIIPQELKDLAKATETTFDDVIETYYFNDDKFKQTAEILEEFLVSLKEQKIPYNIMVLINENDNFTNGVLEQDRGFLYGVVNPSKEIFSFYKTLLSYHHESVIKKIFSVSTFKSILNVDTKDTDLVLNEAVGFTKAEVLQVIKETVEPTLCKSSIDELLDIITSRFDGYSFSNNANQKVIKPSSVFKFLQDLEDNFGNDPDYAQSVSRDYGNHILYTCLKLMPKEVSDKLVDTIIKKNPLYLEDSVAVGKGGTSTQLSYDEGAAMLYYLGFLTVMPHAEVKHSFGEVNPEKTYLKFPNQYTEFQYSKYLLEQANIPWDKLVGCGSLISNMAEQNDLSGLEQGLKQMFG